ncbi:MAG: hypothetical protein KC416_17470, partial [Myxococcales bacterium]|nr:hypothetical protein [Myxococcales bacterium]
DVWRLDGATGAVKSNFIIPAAGGWYGRPYGGTIDDLGRVWVVYAGSATGTALGYIDPASETFHWAPAIPADPDVGVIQPAGYGIVAIPPMGAYGTRVIYQNTNKNPGLHIYEPGTMTWTIRPLPVVVRRDGPCGWQGPICTNADSRREYELENACSYDQPSNTVTCDRCTGYPCSQSIRKGNGNGGIHFSPTEFYAVSRFDKSWSTTNGVDGGSDSLVAHSYYRWSLPDFDFIKLEHDTTVSNATLPTGISWSPVDGSVWVANYAGSVSRHKADGTWTRRNLGSVIYSYSDFLGFGLEAVTEASYTAIVEGCALNTKWNAVTYEATYPPGTSIDVYVRSANNKDAFTGLPADA